MKNGFIRLRNYLIKTKETNDLYVGEVIKWEHKQEAKEGKLIK